MVKPSSNHDSEISINELLSNSLTDLFPEGDKAFDERTNHTLESTEHLSDAYSEGDIEDDDDSQDEDMGFLQQMIAFDPPEQDNGRVIEIEDDSDGSLDFRDVFPGHEEDTESLDSVQEASFAQIICDLDIRDLKREQRKNVVKAFFGPIKSLVKPVKKPLSSHPPKKPLSNHSRPRYFPSLSFRNKRKRVSFEESPTFIVDAIEEPSKEFGEINEEYESTWYNDDDFEAMKREVLKTMERMIWCHKKNRNFPETNDQTSRGLELVTKDMIVERKVYKVSSRFVVYDEQEEQRLAKINDPERIRDLYIEATTKARDIAQELGWKDQETVQLHFEEPFCIEEDETYL